ncbi:MAG: PEP-CTERM sorting domain-containing protein [Limisphaerales bacterium]
MNHFVWAVGETSHKQKGNNMHNKPIKHSTMLALAGLCGVFLLQISSRASTTVLPGWDLFTTVPDGISLNGFTWAGVPLGTYNFGGSIGVQNVGSTDTIIQRLGTSGNGQTVNLQVNAMTLVSTTPIDLNGDLGYLTLDPNYTSDGTITINSDGIFSSTLDVYFDVHYGSLSGPIDTSGEFDVPASGNWTQDPPPNALTIPGVNYLLDGTDTDNDGWIGWNTTDYAFTQEMIPSPEPSSLALLGLGVLCLAIKKRRVQKQATRDRLLP